MEKSIFDIIGEEIEKQGDAFQQKVNETIDKALDESIDAAMRKAINEWDQLWQRSIRQFYYSIPNEKNPGVPKRYKRQGGDQKGTNLYKAKISDVVESEGRIKDFSWRASTENMMTNYRFHSGDDVLNYIAVEGIRFKPPKGEKPMTRKDGTKKRSKTMRWTLSGVKTDDTAFAQTYPKGTIDAAVGIFNDKIEELIVKDINNSFYDSFLKFMKKEKLL